jgi:hypothetical protein
MCFVRISEQTVTLSLHIVSRLGLITDMERVCSAERTESLYSTDTSRPLRVNFYWCRKGTFIFLYNCITVRVEKHIKFT